MDSIVGECHIRGICGVYRRHDVLRRIEAYVKSNNYTQQINQLKNEIKENRDSAAYYNQKVNELNTDKERLEHIAREKYGMKRLNEDVYRTDIP